MFAEPGRVMADTTEDYLLGAKKAEDQAAQATNPKVKETWLKIAEGFRHLAEQLRGRDQRG